MSIYDRLNPEQLRAVKHDKGPLLILAGAGSGKTRVLTHRIAYLIEQRNVNPWNILALTFTNKAASEMRERVDDIVGYGAENIWVSTFHSTCVRILRRYIDRIGYKNSFTIYDSDDQKSLMRDIAKYYEIDTKTLKERSLLSAISHAKDELITPEQYESEAQGDFVKTKYAAVYKEYQKRLHDNNALDFDDLIFKTVELFETCPDILTYYQNRFKYILVDEYQDTNSAQFKLIRILASTVNEDGVKEHNLCVVGDDDQSIYKFRGANIYNILNFEKQFPTANVIKLEQNYRSTKNILNAANEVISNNIGRKDKHLWTDNEDGELVEFTQYGTEYEEAEQVAKDIFDKTINNAIDYNEIAILYRTNAQSRILEEKLIMRNIPYKIVGGVNFYQRKEIKDLICYLKTIDNGADAIAVKRIINVPRRGIGLTTIDRVERYAQVNNISFYDALRHAEHIPGIGRGAGKVVSFVSLIEALKSKIASPNYSLEDLIHEIIDATGYVRELEEQDSEEAVNRIENINELINKVITYESNAEETPNLSEFLEEVALVADIDSLNNSNRMVVLMTLHSAKGLEFPYVYLCGMEDGIFPSYMSITSDDSEDIEEERRLCYVGITRAMKHLYLSASRLRMVRGENQYNRPSRFIQEIPRYLIKQNIGSDASILNRNQQSKQTSANTGGFIPVSGRATSMSSKGGSNPFANHPLIQKGVGGLQYSASAAKGSFQAKPFVTSAPQQTDTIIHYQVGDSVNHIKFGTGIVTALDKTTKDYEVTVAFETKGVKKMLASFAKMKKMN